MLLPTLSLPSREAPLDTQSTLHRWPTSRFVPVALMVFLFGSCSTLFGDRSAAVDASGEAVAAEPVEEPAYTGPETIEDEYPFIRFIDHMDGTYSALITVPSMAVTPEEDLPIQQALKTYVTCFQEGGTATMDRKQGYVFHNDNKIAYNNKGKFEPVEEILVVRGTEDDLRDVLNFIDVWINSGPMIEIQAEVFETQHSDEFDRSVQQIGTDPFFQDVQGQTFLRNLSGSFPSDNAGAGGVFSLGLLDSSFRVDAAISLLAKKGFVDVKSRPRIITRNGVAAVMKSTEQVPFLSVANNATVSLSGAANFSIQRSPVGVALTVTPFLIGADTVHLVIDVNISTLGREFDLGLDGAGNKITAPSTTERSAQTEVYVRNGEAVVIGGLMLKESQKIESKIPLLGDLPLLGWLFSSLSEVEQTTEVFFVIRPKLKARPSIDPFGDFFDPFDEAKAKE
jgi:type II secretory pathway component GspD/PulD (secretin)